MWIVATGDFGDTRGAASVTVARTHTTYTEASLANPKRDLYEVYYIPGYKSRDPKPGDILGLWNEGTTTYAIAPRL